MSNNALTNLLVIYLTTPETDFYLSKMIGQNKDLNPLKTSQEINIGTFEFFNQKITPILHGVNVKGLDNIQIAKKDGKPDVEVSGGTVSFTAVRPNTGYPPKGATASLVVSTTLVLDAGGNASPPVAIKINVANGNLLGTFETSGDPSTPSSVGIKFTSLSVAAETTPKNIVVDLSQLKSVFRQSAEAFLKKESTLKTLVEQLNKELTKPEILASVSQAGTKAAQSSLAKFNEQ